MTNHELPISELEHQPPLFTEREMLEGMSDEELIILRDDLLSRTSDFERVIHLINDVRAGAGYDS